MDQVIYSGYIPVRELFFVCCFINKQCYHCVRTKCNPKALLNMKRKGVIVRYEPFRVMTCEKCNIKCRCTKDVFNSVIERVCTLCQPTLLTLTETRTYLDRHITELLDRAKKGTSTYFLEQDVRAYNFIFMGPRDRCLIKKQNQIELVNKRIVEIHNLFETCKIARDDRDTLQHNSRIIHSLHGIQHLKKVLKKGYKHAKKVCVLLSSEYATLAQCLDWAVAITHFPRRFVVHENNIYTQAQEHITKKKIQQREKMLREQRRHLLVQTMHSYNIDAYFINPLLYRQYYNQFLYLRFKQNR